jgi:hypothetical protein
MGFTILLCNSHLFLWHRLLCHSLVHPVFNSACRKTGIIIYIKNPITGGSLSLEGGCWFFATWKKLVGRRGKNTAQKTFNTICKSGGVFRLAMCLRITDDPLPPPFKCNWLVCLYCIIPVLCCNREEML